MQRVGLTHFLFIDDLLLFCCVDVDSNRAVMEQFRKSSESSGLFENPAKCDVYFAGASEDVKQEICSYCWV